MTAEQWHIVVPLAPTQDEWVQQFAAAIREVDPDVDADRAQAAMRWAMRVPRPRKPSGICLRCDGTGGVDVGPGLVAWERQYDECPACGGTGTWRRS